jgi:hypothetical protein
MDEAQIIEALGAGDLQRQMSGLNEAVRVVHTLMSESIRAFAGTQAHFRLRRTDSIRSGVVPMLEDLFRQPLDEDGRKHAATLLLKLGSKAGVPRPRAPLPRPTPRLPSSPARARPPA